MDGTARSGMGLTKVIGPSKGGNMVEKVDKEGIENIRLNENQGRFTQPMHNISIK